MIMGKLIVFCGYSGTGKTTLANKLSKKLHIPCLHKDSFKEPIYKHMSCKTFKDSFKSGYCFIMTLLNVAEDQIENGVDLIIESPFNHAESLEQFKNWIKKYKLDFYCVICSLDEKTRLKRCRNRLDKRDKCHHDEKRLAILHSSITSDFDYNNMPEKKIFVDTKKPVNELLKEVLANTQHH